MRLKSLLFTFSIFMAASHLDAQRLVGQWKDHLTYQNSRGVTQSEQKVIYHTPFSIVTVDKEDLSHEFISKSDGLTKIGISTIAFDEANDFLIIAYQDGSLDLVSDHGVSHLSSIRDNQIIQGAKTINQIAVVDQSTALLSTNFGVLILDTSEEIFRTTIFTNIEVFEATEYNGFYYLATEDGLYFKNRTDRDLVDFSSWELLSSDALPTVYQADHILQFEDDLVVQIEEDLYKIGEEQDVELFYSRTDSQYSTQDLYTDGSDIYLAMQDQGTLSKIVVLDQNGTKTQTYEGCNNRIVELITDQYDRIWTADLWNTFRFLDIESGNCQRLDFNSPYDFEVSDLDIADGNLYAASGGVSDSYTYAFNRDGFYAYDGSLWTNYNQNNIPEFQTRDILNFFRVLKKPDSDTLFVGTYWAGLLEFDVVTGEFKQYTQENSPLRGLAGDPARERISGLVMDEREVLWVANFGSETPLCSYTSAGDWQCYGSAGNDFLINPEVDEFNNVWAPAINFGGGIFVFNDGGTTDNRADDLSMYITNSNSAITSDILNCVTKDLEGDVWVGTSEGPVVFSGNPFSGGNQGRRIRVVENGIPAFLLSDENILTIAVDGGNRKWFGTENGIFVQSDDGSQQVHRYNIDNSPLISNKIVDLEYNGENGLMYIATELGIQSLKTETLEGKSFHSVNTYAFPNPIPYDYAGPISIKGLAVDTRFTITDIDGNIVYKGTSLGSLGTWDGISVLGSKASPGVYLVFAIAGDGLNGVEKLVTKFVIKGR